MKDEKWLNSQFPFRLVPTNLDDVYTTAPLPGNLDLKTATSSTLWQHGLPFHRPKAGDKTEFAKLWNKISERGLQIVTPHVERRPKAVRRGKVRPKLEKASVAGFNWCGGVLERPRILFEPGAWTSVYGAITLPYLSVPAGVQGMQTAGLSAWVGLDGWGGNGQNNELLQAILWVNLQQTPTGGFTTFFNTPTWQWWVPDPTDPYASLYGTGGVLSNPPAMNPGDLVFVCTSYIQAMDGSMWGGVFYLFLSDLELGGFPLLPFPLFNFLFPAPSGAQCYGATIEWILENESVTNNQPNTTVPVFSAAPGSITPISFSRAGGFNQAPGVSGDPNDGFPVLWSSLSGVIDTVASVTLSPGTVSISYTG